MRRHLTTPAVGGLNHDTGLGRKRANRAAHERSSTMGSMYLVCLAAKHTNTPLSERRRKGCFFIGLARVTKL